MFDKPFDLIEHLRDVYDMQARLNAALSDIASLQARVMDLELVTEKMPRPKPRYHNISEPRRTS